MTALIFNQILACFSVALIAACFYAPEIEGTEHIRKRLLILAFLLLSISILNVALYFNQ